MKLIDEELTDFFEGKGLDIEGKDLYTGQTLWSRRVCDGDGTTPWDKLKKPVEEEKLEPSDNC